MKNVTITINATISIKVNNGANKHHNKSRNHPTTNKNGKRMIPERVELFFAHGECDSAVTARELIVHYGKIFALDIFTLKGIEAKSVTATYGTIVPDGKGGIKLFSDRHKRWYPCSVQNSVYSIKNLISDARKYDL